MTTNDNAVASAPQFFFVASDGFEWNVEHRMWHNKETKVTVRPSHSAETTYQATVEDFTPERMKQAGAELTLKESRDINGRATLLMLGNRLNAKYPQQFCTVVYETEEGCAQLTAIYPSTSSDSAKESLKSALLNSRYGLPQ